MDNLFTNIDPQLFAAAYIQTVENSLTINDFDGDSHAFQKYKNERVQKFLIEYAFAHNTAVIAKEGYWDSRKDMSESYQTEDY